MKPRFAEVDAYISELFAPEDEILLSIEPALVAAGSSLAFASVSPAQGKLLQLFAHMCGAKRILEVGTLGGYSTIWMARALPHNGKLVTIEYDEKHIAVAKKHFEMAGLNDRIEIKQGKAMDVLQELSENNAEPFDMVFIDADKPPYAEYFELALKMCRKGSIIIADNVVRSGKVLDETSEDAAVQGVQRFNHMLSYNEDVHANILQTVGVKDWDGMAIAVVK